MAHSFHFYGIYRIGQSTDKRKVDQWSPPARRNWNWRVTWKQEEDTRAHNHFCLCLYASSNRRDWRHQLPISLSACRTIWSVPSRGPSTSCVMHLSDRNASCASSYSLSSKYHLCPHLLSPPASAFLARDYLRSAHLSCRAPPSAVWAIAMDATLRVSSTCLRELLLQFSTF